MKRIILTFCLAFLVSAVGFTQDELKFSRVLLVDALQTVPQGHVWKVTNVMYNTAPPTSSGTSLYQSNNYIEINGQSVHTRNFRSRNHSSASTQAERSNALDSWEMRYPMWLPEGTTLAVTGSVLYISVIEFAVVP